MNEAIADAELISRYENLVKARVNECMARAARHDPALAFNDLFQAGVEGLVRASRSYDSSLGVPLQAHLAIRVRYAVYMEYTRSSQVSKHHRAVRRMFDDDRERLEAIYGRAVTDEELADFLAMSPQEIEQALARAHAATPELVHLEDTQLPDLPDNGGKSVEEEVHGSQMSAMMRKAMGQLKDNERTVLSAMFFEDLSLTEAGRKLGVSKQRAAVIRDRGLARIRELLPGLSPDDIP